MTLDRASNAHGTNTTIDSTVAEVIPLSSLDVTSWRNGGGTTRRIAAGCGGHEPDWALSLADIEKRSAFSTFAGVDRAAVVVGDDPVDMTINGTSRTLGLLDRVSFAGEDDVEAGPVRGATYLLNLMTRRGVVVGALNLRHIRGRVAVGPGNGRAWVVLTGALRVNGAELCRWDTVLLGRQRNEISGAATVAVVHISSSADVVRRSPINDEESPA
ncbi:MULTISPECIES: HutD/Ves family protein [Gordonia]|uniref:HutD/Ves family protein n=1 Tax=Gordonia TaxID=2053 RepID=UPI001EF545A9|nr:HutD family protein [Gordonia sp. McavH-238-E]MCG7634415.1 HutD family protein [Gordonia sp. McavH-238-E]